jgi:hypothetical protein
LAQQKKPRLATNHQGVEQTNCNGVFEVNVSPFFIHCNLSMESFMLQEIKDIARGSDGIGCCTLNRNFIRLFGLDAALFISDLLRAYQWSEKNKTLDDDWFLWNPNNLEYNLQFPHERLTAAIRVVDSTGILQVKTTPSKELMFRFNIEKLSHYGKFQPF